tara:strand:- start:1339 stop:2751 length:1413 start_codon:yes stop_codon:yes gene_type:complete
MIENICCIGAGYVGGPTMAVLAEKCPNIKVNVVDLDINRIKLWNSKNVNEIPIFEPGLAEIVSKIRDKNLFFSNNIEESIKEADLIFISVNTPTKIKGLGANYASDLKWIESSARQVAKFAIGHTIVVEKSTVPVRTAELIKTILNSSEDFNLNNKNKYKKTFSVISSPEFLAEGNAIKDLRNPDRVLIGGEDKDSIDKLCNIYENWIPKEKILVTNLWSSELSKLTANAFLAQRISSINSISAICEKTGAEIGEVSAAIGSDSRIGPKFLSSSPGFGGSCFKKDILNLVYLCRYYGLDVAAEYWENVIRINNWQKDRISKIIVDKFFGTITGKKIALFGFSFKANTNDTRESASIDIANNLIDNGAKLVIHDPRVSQKQIEFDLKQSPSIFDQFQESIWVYEEDIMKAVKLADAIVILTEWDYYRNLNWKLIIKGMRKPSWIFDTRGLISKETLKDLEINFWSLGNGCK